MVRGLLTFAFLLLVYPVAHAQDSLPDSVRKEFQSYVGVWDGTIELEGEKTPAKWSASWAPGNHCLIIHEEYSVGGEPGKITALMGYDRIKKQVVNIGFRTDGGNRTLTYADGYVSGKGTGDGPEGQTWNSRFKIVKGETEWAFEFKGTSPDAKDFVIRLRKNKS
jgi:hypothetical protein